MPLIEMIAGVDMDTVMAVTVVITAVGTVMVAYLRMFIRSEVRTLMDQLEEKMVTQEAYDARVIYVDREFERINARLREYDEEKKKGV